MNSFTEEVGGLSRLWGAGTLLFTAGMNEPKVWDWSLIGQPQGHTIVIGEAGGAPGAEE